MNDASEEKSHNNNNNEVSLVNWIKLNENCTLTHLSLPNLNLETLPECIVQMKLLQHLDLSHNLLRKVPTIIITHLELLQTLNLSHNKIEYFDDEPQCYKKIKYLYLSNNCLVNIPEWILHVRCLNLEVFDYSFNLVTDLSQSRFCFYYPHNLRELFLKNCRLRDKHLTCVSSIYSLETLDLSNVKEKDSNHNSFMNIEKLFVKPYWVNSLKVLKLCDLQITELPQELSLLKSLRELHLRDNNVDSLHDCLQNLSALELLDVSLNKLYYLNLVGLDNLKYLFANGNIIGTFNFAGRNNLCLVDLYDNELQNVDLDLNSVPYVDLDFNFISDIKVCDYIEKKVALRKFRNMKCRSDEQKNFDIYVEPENDSGTISDYVEEPDRDLLDDKTCKQYGSDEELWDVPIEDNNDSLSIPDNNWTGEESRSSSVLSVKCNSRNDDDINCYQLFADAT